jgi:DUF971 family protein
MRPTDIQTIGQELAIKWDTGEESFIPLERLRRACPCAGCQGERDILGTVHRGPEQRLTAQSFELVRLVSVGAYALQPIWADGHNTGLYAFDYLRHLSLAQPPD